MPGTAPPLWQVLEHPPCAQPDSLFWHPREARLYWVDTALRQLCRLHPRSGHFEHLTLPQEPGSVAPCRSGGLLLALRDGIYHLSSWQDLPRKIAAAPYDSTRQRFANGRCDPWGRFWVGTQVDALDRPDGALYCLHTRHQAQPELQLVERGVVAANGLAWSPNGQVLYWSDSARHHIESHAMSQPGGWPPQLGTPMPFAHFPAPPSAVPAATPTAPYAGRPGGAAVDQAGQYWVAMPEGSQVLCLNDRGQVLSRHPTPAQCPTSLCFGGPDLRTLYVVSARLHRDHAELTRYPHSGQVLALTVDHPGLPVNLYWD